MHPQEEMKGTIDNELATVITSTALACKQIASLVNRSGISNLTGLAGAANVQVRIVLFVHEKNDVGIGACRCGAPLLRAWRSVIMHGCTGISG